MLVLGLSWPASARALTLPPDFEDQPVAAVSDPTALAFTPDGRMLVTAQGGKLHVYQDGALLASPAIDLSSRICSNSERGVVGVAVDPAFASNGFVYLYYTFKKHGVCETLTSSAPVNRVSRFVLGANNAVDPASETILIDNIPSPAGFHNAGDLQFGMDGNLYVSVGDGGCDYAMDSGCSAANDAARDLYALLGKVLRVTRDGEIPAGNPFVGQGTDRCNVTGSTTAGRKCRETYSWGFRNPWRLGFDPNSAATRFYVNDVGQNTWEEIDEGAPGADFGWNVREGPCALASTADCGPPPPGMINPVYEYDHSAGCAAITGGAFVPNGVWPAEYDGSYLFADYVCGKIFKLDPADSGGFTVLELASGGAALVGLTFGPVGAGLALYYLDRAAADATVRRIVHIGEANHSPLAVARASPRLGDLPLTVDFDGSSSSDPDGDAVSWDWDFGDGTPHSTNPIDSHTYTEPGTYVVTLRVYDPFGAKSTATLRIYAGDNPPLPVITSPETTETFSVGEQLVLHGSATDPEEGQLLDAALTWEVVKHHASHTHPFLLPTAGNDVPITGPIPEDADSTQNTYLEMRLTATDAWGVSTTVTRRLDPQLVDLTFRSDPEGRQVVVQGTALTTPSTIASWDAWNIPVDAPLQFDPSGDGYAFLSWSDGGARAHTIATPPVPTTYVARFTRTYVRPKGAVLDLVSLVPAYEPCAEASSNRSHGNGLPSSSCSPSVQASHHLTLGTPDANGLGARGSGSARMQARIGNPSTPADEADVSFSVSVDDVREKSSLADYAGELRASIPLRMTDRLNGALGDESGTVVDTPFRVAVPCVPTADPALGSSCATVTSADAIVPEAVAEGSRAIWETDAIQVLDGGADGIASTDPNDLFMVQGYFLP